MKATLEQKRKKVAKINQIIKTMAKKTKKDTRPSAGLKKPQGNVDPKPPKGPTPEDIRVQNVKEAEYAKERLDKLVRISEELNTDGVGTSTALIKAIEKAKINLDERKKLAGQ